MTPIPAWNRKWRAGEVAHSNRNRSVQRNRIPNELSAMLVPVAGFSFEKVESSVGAVDFEPLLLGHEVASFVPTQIVQDGGYCMGFKITALELGDLCGDDAACIISESVILLFLTMFPESEDMSQEAEMVSGIKE